ncbi:B3/B4 domain-containing protein [Microbacterium marinilacus]|uniref:B3/4 domain-containing protein n=1 Tax=Microbacterium marinilacus TaxID=415209 RepID=A0ABP7B4P2_9MICO|nr:phenylalanine--tRNA ligase beta subunit-related protein [Microbacterium marinilacus]MBY0687929.1 hypothetical protein [Microbacterium marinilacus]
MPDPTHALDHAVVSAEVFSLRPDYRAALLGVTGLSPGPTDAAGEALLREAESAASAALAAGPLEEIPHVAAWREAYRDFGAKPQRTRHSLEALLRRAASDGLPRVNRLTDLYNAISVLHLLPIGGEDLDRYEGAPQLVRATGDELFDTMAGGTPSTEHPDGGEVVWRDDGGVTCRRWNWRQGRRTQLTDETTSALFILDALGPLDDDALEAAAAELAHRLVALGDDVHVAHRILRAPND